MSIYEDLPPISLDGASTYPLASRPSKVTVEDFGARVTKDSSLSDYLDSLPNILAVQSLRDLTARMRRAHAASKPIIWGLGGHVVKTGLAPVILDLMSRGFVTAIAGNGSVLVHDAEIAMVGSTSEDVDATLGAGAFGGAEETGRLLNGAAREGAREGLGLGEALGRALLALKPRHENLSLLCAAYKARLPFTAQSRERFSCLGFSASNARPSASPKPNPSRAPSRAAPFKSLPVSSAPPNAPAPNLASTSSEVDPAIAISASWTSTYPLPPLPPSN